MTVIRIQAVAPLVLAVLSTVAFGQSSGHEPSSPGRKTLTLSLSCSNAKVSGNQSVVLEVRLTNSASTAISIFGTLLWGEGGGLMLHVFDSKGHPVTAEQHDDDLVVPSVLDKPDSYVVLRPNHFLGVIRTDTPRNLFHNRAGTYRLLINYRSPVPARYKKSTDFWAREDGILESNVCEMEYAPR